MPAHPRSLPCRLDALLPADAAGTQASLWLGLVALDLHECSGFVPANAGTIPTTSPAPAEVMRPCPPEAESTLASLLLGVRPPALLTQWMGSPQHHAARLPARFLPALLESAMRHATLRPALLPVLGERGRWLAALREDWAWARVGGENDRDMWGNGLPRSAHRHPAQAARVPPGGRARN